jgi:hypothetical protein
VSRVGSAVIVNVSAPRVGSAFLELIPTRQV